MYTSSYGICQYLDKNPHIRSWTSPSAIPETTNPFETQELPQKIKGVKMTP